MKLFYTTQFKKDYKRIKNEKKIVDELKNIVNKLLNDESLSSKYRDHPLICEYKGFRECHIKPNLLLIYRKDEKAIILTLARIGSHSKLFK
jgi:mRNA interferase YafQ